MLISLLFIILVDASKVVTYRNFYTLINNLESTNESEKICSAKYSSSIVSTTSKMIPRDPLCKLDDYINNFIFDGDSYGREPYCKYQEDEQSDRTIFPTGSINRPEYVGNSPGVHMPDLEHIYAGSSRLRHPGPEGDLMQAAVDAFFLVVHGDVNDVMSLPPGYVLRSANTLSMMKISLEKLTALWTVVKNGRHPVDISVRTLELYRPLFKYVNAREMARLNLSDPKIVLYLGTHPDLNRHQVGVIARKLVALRPSWHRPALLTLMNNLLCGLPVVLLRQIRDDALLQLAPSVFYHIYACDPLQVRFFYHLMTKPQVLGKAYSWGFEQVFKLGLLLTEARGAHLTTVKPHAIAAITPQVMAKMKPINLRYLTEQQKAKLQPNVRNILRKKLRSYTFIRRGISTANTPQPLLFIMLLFHTSVKVLTKCL